MADLREQLNAIADRLDHLDGHDVDESEELEWAVKQLKTLAAQPAPAGEVAERGCVHHDFSMLDSYVRNLRWSHDTPDTVRDAVASNLRGLYTHLLTRGLFAGSGSWDAGRLAAAKWVEKRRCAFADEYGLVDPATGVLEFGNGYPERDEYYSELSVIEEAIRSLPAPQFVAHTAPGEVALPETHYPDSSGDMWPSKDGGRTLWVRYDDAIAYGDARAAAAVAQAVPEGWVMVTAKLTAAAGLMLSEIDTCGHEVDTAYRTTLYEAWDEAKAMLSAAPQPAAVKQDLTTAQEDPCPNCTPGVVCKTPKCGRLAAEQIGRRAQWEQEYADLMAREPTRWQPEAKAGAEDIFAAYETWPDDIRAKLSLHDLRRMGGWAPRPNPDGWAIDMSAGRPILVLNGCSVIEAEDARYVLGLIRGNRQPKPAEGGAVGLRIAGWMHEDELPEDYPYDAMFPHSKVDGVRMFPVFAPAAATRAEEMEALASEVGEYDAGIAADPIEAERQGFERAEPAWRFTSRTLAEFARRLAGKEE